jgi:hypothetical protein
MTMKSTPDRSDHWSGGLDIFILLVTGFFCMFISLGFEVVTVRGSYTGVIVAALLFTALANICFATAFRRGRTATRVASVVGILPTLFVIVEGSCRLFHSLTP